MQKSNKAEMSLFEHVARMGDDRKLKTVMLGVMEGKNKRGSHTENGRTT